MEELNRQVQRAQRRLNLQTFLQSLVWCLFGALSITVIGTGVRKFWVLPGDAQIWFWGWLGGSLLLGVAAAAVWSYVGRSRKLDAALAIDHRFGLKERVSSGLSLSEQDAQTPAGQALLSDAARRIERIDVSEKFHLETRWWNLLPLAPAIVVFALAVLVPDAVVDPTASDASAANPTVKKQVKTSTQTLKKKMADRRKKAAEAGLDEAGELLNKLEKGVEGLANKDDVDRRKAMIELSDLADEIKQRRDSMLGKEELKKQLGQLNNLQQGPADRMARAMKNGEFQKALDELKSLQQKLRDGDLSESEKQALAEQMKQMAKKMNDVANAQSEAKRQLEDQIQQAKQAGDMQRAQDLQAKLDDLNRQSQSMKQLQQMAQKLSQASQQMQNGETAEAAQSLEELGETLESMQQELDELEMLNETMDEFAQAKRSMNCDKCMGAGCEFCQGFGFGRGEMPGQGLGEGQGVGDRPEQETDSQFYESRVRGEGEKTKAVVVGTATGRNITGNVAEELKEVLQAAESDDADPLTGQRLPKAQRRQAQQYFDAITGNNP